MADVVVRPYEDRDESGFHTVLGLTYRNGDTSVPENRSNDYLSYVAELEGQIVGAFISLPMTVSRREASLKCGGVAAVGVAPDCRRGGVGSAMMSWYVRHGRESGTPLASLYAFRETFYRRFGYEVVGKRTRIIVPAERLPKVEANLPIRRLGWEDWEQLVPCYRAFAHERSGLNLRLVPSQWKRILAENKALTIYAFGDPIEGYVAVSHNVAFWVEQGLSEFVWSTPRGYANGLAFLRQLGINKTHVAWFEPSDSPFYAQYLDQGIEAKIERPIMFRVNDVPGALEQLVPEGSGEFSFAVDDPVVPENSGVWKVEWSDGSVRVQPGTHAGFRLSIQAFTQAFMGEPSLADLVRFGLVEVTDRASISEALRLLTPTPTVCMDFF